MWLNSVEANGVSLARRTSQNTARIACTVGNLAISRAFSRTVLTVIIIRVGALSPASHR
jgi:hypothetical protein